MTPTHGSLCAGVGGQFDGFLGMLFGKLGHNWRQSYLTALRDRMEDA